VVIGDIMKELLCVQRTAQKQSEIAIGSFDDIRDLVDGFPSVEGVLVSEPVFDSVGERYTIAESVCDPGEQCRVYDGSFLDRAERGGGVSTIVKGRWDCGT
jgi:hypothetical protein